MKSPRNNQVKMGLNFIGLGKLGLPLSCILAESGFEMQLFDKSPQLIKCLTEGKVPFFEPGLEDLFKKVKFNFVAYNEVIDNSILNNDTTIILVNTQDSEIGYSRKNVEDVINQIAQVFQSSKPKHHNIILSSTVTVGDIEYLSNIIESKSGWIPNRDFSFIYVPDFVKLGNTLNDFKNPEFVMVGASNENDFAVAKAIWSQFVAPNTHFGHLSHVEAELGKIALNAYIVNKISFANHLGLIANMIGNVDTNSITSLIGMDKRISPYFFSSGTPYGGTCFPRDAKAYSALGRRFNFPSKHLDFAEEINVAVMENIFSRAKIGERIGIVGVSFKPDSPVLVESPSIKLINMLKATGKEIVYFDNLVEEENQVLIEHIRFHSLTDLFEYCDTVVLMHPIKIEALPATFGESKDQLIIDPWGVIKNSGL